MMFGEDFPEFLDAQAIMLRLTVLVQAKLLDDLLAQVATATLGKDRVLAMQLVASLETAFFLAFLVTAHVASGDTDHGTLVISSTELHTVDALAIRGDEGRCSLR